ncbi:tetratricopeptide repeat domain-containing protein [Xylariaceae sp. FL1272]|nr:tetratricopeptide repeat domain-containing protein [Xylariaceae sp. FL1272]
MAEPFSVAAAAVGLVEVTARFCKYVNQLRRNAKSIQPELESLVLLVKSCEQVVGAFQDTHLDTNHQTCQTGDNWMDICWMMEHSQTLVAQLHKIIEGIFGAPPHTSTKLDAWKLAYRRLAKDGDLDKCKRELEFYQRGMSIIIQRADEHHARKSRKDAATSLEDLHDQIGLLRSDISNFKNSIPLSGDRDGTEAAQTLLSRLQACLVPPDQRNVHFFTPQSVQSFFTGRKQLLQQLSDVFIQPAEPAYHDFQRRFVVHGIGGSGKTQFCCKFADMNREKFWGVFWIDGSSDESIKRSLVNIARLPGREPNANAALDWLSNVEEKWLLIIDNADDGSVKLENYFPKGRGGHILITTRNPRFKTHGTVDPRYYDFSELVLEEAADLLLKASDLPRPWKPAWESSASKITKALGQLALAIVHAAAAIRDQLCELDSYLEYFDRQWRKIRNDPTIGGGNGAETAVFVSFEVCFARLQSRSVDIATQDASDILHIFAFLWRENLSLDIIMKAMRNASVETQEVATDEDIASLSNNRSNIGTKLLSKLTGWYLWITAKSPAPVLPNVIRAGRQGNGFLDAVDRVRRALRELAQLSLIYYNYNDDTYTMHPLVHKWARERVWDRQRPRVSLADQALWAEIAGQVLAASILLPPLGSSIEHETYNLKILSHVQHVQACWSLITAQLDRANTSHRIPWLRTRTEINASRVKMYAKFCVVYAQCGIVDDAKVLLEQVVGFVSKYLGLQNKRTRDAKVLLSSIYWQLGEIDKALELQREIVVICEKYLGIDHPDTMMAWNKLGTSYWQQGKFSDARHLQTKAVVGLRRRLGNEHAATLEAIDDLGRTTSRFWSREAIVSALEMHEEAVLGMEKISHTRVTFAKDSLARMLGLLGQDLERALQLMEEVIEDRTRRNGKEAPWTLMAVGSKAMVLSAMGRLEEAESLMYPVLDVASRNFGADHIGVLAGRQALATILNHQGRYAEAEYILKDVSERQRTMPSRRGDYHPDRIVSLSELARCYQLQGKLEQSIIQCDEAVRGINSLTQTSQPFRDMLIAARAQMQDMTTIAFPEHSFKAPTSSQLDHHPGGKTRMMKKEEEAEAEADGV